MVAQRRYRPLDAEEEFEDVFERILRQPHILALETDRPDWEEIAQEEEEEEFDPLDADALAEALDAGAVGPDDVSADDEPLVVFTARMNAADSVRVLLDAGADAEGALDAAIVNGALDTASLLLERGYRAGLAAEGRSLNIAIERYDLPMVALVASYGEDLDLEDETTGATPLLAAVRALEPDEAGTIVRTLVESGADINFQSEGEGVTPLMAAAETEDLDLVKLLVSLGSDPAQVDAEGHIAVSRSRKFGPVWEYLIHLNPHRRRVRVERLRDE